MMDKWSQFPRKVHAAGQGNTNLCKSPGKYDPTDAKKQITCRRCAAIANPKRPRRESPPSFAVDVADLMEGKQ